MRKLITIILVLAASVAFSQTTYQLNYDSIRVGKTAGNGATSLYGKTYLKNATEGAPSDSVLTVRNGRVYKIAGSAISSVGFLTYVFSRDASDIAGYEQMPALTSYTIGAADTATVAATTTPAIIQEFATNTGFPNTTLIPAGVFNVTYQTQKNSGSQSYYTYAIIYKRNLSGTETAIATTNNSSSVSANTVQSVSVSAVSPTDISLLTTDRIVVKVFAVMVSGTANISIYYDDATDSRLAFPSALVDATNFVPYNGAVKDLVSAFSIMGDSIKRVGGTGAQFLKGDGSVTLLGVKSISQTPDNNGLSYLNDTLRLHAVTPTTGGVLTNGIDSIGGDKYFADQIWVTENQQHGGHIGIVSGSGSLMAPLLGSASETSTYWMQILAHPAPNLYNTNPTDGIIFQVYDNEGPDPITAGRAFNFRNGTTSVFNIDFAGDGNLWGGLNMFDNRISNGAISLGSGAPGSLNPTLNANSESNTAWFNFGGFPATNIDNTNPADAFRFNAYKTSDGSTALTGGNLVNFFNKNVSKFSVDYNGVITSAGLGTGAVYSSSGVLSNTAPTSGTIGYWSRTGTVLSPATSGDDITTTGDISAASLTLSDNITATGLNSTGQATLGSLNQGGKMNFVSGGTGVVGGTLGFSTNATTNILSLQNIQGLELTSTNSNGYVAVRATGANGAINFRTGSNINGYVHPSGNWSFQNGGTFTDNGYRIDVNGTGRFTSALTANSFVKSGGTSSQFLKADGSIDANSYTALNGTGIVEMSGTTPSYLSSTGSGNVVKATSPTLTTPNIGNATGGTLSLSGTLTSTQGNNTTVYNSSSATTGYQFFNMQNTSGRLLWGIDGSAGGTFMTGGSAYSGAMTTVGAQNLELGTNQIKALTIDGTTQNATFTGVVKDAGVVHAFASKSANYTLTDNDYYITVTADATITLPSASGRAGKRYVIKAVGAGVDVTISTYTLSGNNENVLILFSDGSSWLTETYISGV